MKIDKYLFLQEHKGFNSFGISKYMNWSVGKTHKIKKELIADGFLKDSKNLDITPKGVKLLEKNAVKDAVIYAAGKGSRLRPITNHTPKPLVFVHGKPIIEHLLDRISKELETIYIVVGYLKEQFDYLITKYKNVKLIVNDKYENENNISSLISVLPFLNSNTLFFEGDVYWTKNDILMSSEESWMYGEDAQKTGEWTLIKKGSKIKGYEKGGNGPLWGNAYCLVADDINKIKFNLRGYNKESFAESLIWENGILPTYIRVETNQRYEIDTLEDYSKIETYEMISTFSNPFEVIMYAHKCINEDITEFEVLKGGLTNDVYSYKLFNIKYVLRFPKDVTNKHIDRVNEEEILMQIKDWNLTYEVYYINSKAGVMITKFIENATSIIDWSVSWTEATQIYKRIHNGGVKSSVYFSPVQKLHEYTANNIPSELIPFVDKFNDLAKERFESTELFTLSHNDANIGNWLSDGDKLWLIDWELASMNHQYWDLCSLVIENDINDDIKDRIIYEMGFNDKIFKDIQFVILFLWTAWCFQYPKNKWDDGVKKYYKKSLRKLKVMNEK